MGGRWTITLKDVCKIVVERNLGNIGHVDVNVRV